MRVLLSCFQSLRRHPIPAYDFWRDYFVKGLEEAGCEVVEIPGVDWAEGIVHRPGPRLDEWRTRTWETVAKFARQERAGKSIDLFLTYLYPQQVDESALAELRRIGIRCVNFFCDNVREFRAIPASYRAFDLHWVPEFEALGLYRRAGLRHIHAPMPCWIPQNLRGVPAVETEPPSFIGSADHLRRLLFGQAIAAGADLILWGNGWEGEPLGGNAPWRSPLRMLRNQAEILVRQGAGALLTKLDNRLYWQDAAPIPQGRVRGAVSAEEYIRITREAMVTVGVSRVSTPLQPDRRPLRYSRLRDIEAPMLGACYLTEWTEGVERLYELGAEIETYRTPEEMAAKLAELSGDSQRRGAMRERAQRRALSDYSVPRTVKRISEMLF